jgi:predicted Zn-dependent protease
MLGERELKQIADKVLALSEADQTEVLVMTDESALTRFANNYVHQNVSESNRQVNVRAVQGKKIGVARTNDLSDEGLRRVVENARTIARFQRENADFKSLPGPEDAGTRVEIDGFVERTASATPEMRAEAAGTVCRLASDNA